MPINFPDYKDVRLRNAPLREVLCQVRFPVILRLVREEPAELQEKILDRYPDLEVEQGVIVEGGSDRPALRAGVKPAIYKFRNPDQGEAVSVAPDFFALSTTEYTEWPKFAESLEYVTQAVLDTYQIQHATRIGLRYINTFDLDDSLDEMLKIFQPELTAMLRADVMVDPSVLRYEMRTKVNDDGMLTFRFGLSQEAASSEPHLTLDFDRYIAGRVQLDNLLERCTRYHEDIYRAFRWAIAEEQLVRFDPVEPIDEGV